MKRRDDLSLDEIGESILTMAGDDEIIHKTLLQYLTKLDLQIFMNIQ